MANPWFRLYSRIMTDPKVECLAFEDQRHFVWLLCMKNEGYLDEEYPNQQARERMVARKLGLQGEAFENTKLRLTEVGLIDGDWQPVSWDDLQFKSDSSKERVRKYREKQRLNGVKQDCNVTVTLQDKEEDKDKEKEEEKNTAPQYPGWLNLDLWREWKSTRQTGKTKYTKHAEKLGLSKLSQLCPNGENHEAVINQSIERGWKTFYPLKDNQTFDDQRRARNDAAFKEFLNG